MEALDPQAEQETQPLPREEGEEAELEHSLEVLLESISRETAHLKQFLVEESRLVNELCVSISYVMKRLNISFEIPPQSLLVDKEIRRVILNQDGKLILFSPDGVRSTALAEHDPRTVMQALRVVMPKLTEVVAKYRRRVTARVSFFEKLKGELMSIAKAVGRTQEHSQREETANVRETRE